MSREKYFLVEAWDLLDAVDEVDCRLTLGITNFGMVGGI